MSKIAELEQLTQKFHEVLGQVYLIEFWLSNSLFTLHIYVDDKFKKLKNVCQQNEIITMGEKCNAI